MPKATINRKGAGRVRAGHLWIYKSDVVNVNGAPGDVVTVSDEANNFIGQAFYSAASEITLRILTIREETIDREFWRLRIRKAAERRGEIYSGREGNWREGGRRIVFSEGDLIPSLIVDDYAGVFVIQTLSQGTEKLKSLFIEILIQEFAPRAIVERNDVPVRAKENLSQASSIASGAIPDELIINQDGLKFYVSPLAGQKTGSFLDQRENHHAARNYARGRGLDCFSFNGAFALNLSGNCGSVTAIDISAEAVKQAGRNARLNEINNVEFRTANVFDALVGYERKRERFDTIVLDPPAFVKSRSALRSAVRGYKEINLRALKLLNTGGILISSSCSFHFSEVLFLETLADAARDAGRRIHIVEKRAQSTDHPVLLGMPETHYLKCFVLRAVE
jgi:23S rRNA (cytosine1962-C5)-methyltransferase